MSPCQGTCERQLSSVAHPRWNRSYALKTAASRCLMAGPFFDARCLEYGSIRGASFVLTIVSSLRSDTVFSRMEAVIQCGYLQRNINRIVLSHAGRCRCPVSGFPETCCPGFLSSLRRRHAFGVPRKRAHFDLSPSWFYPANKIIIKKNTRHTAMSQPTSPFPYRASGNVMLRRAMLQEQPINRYALKRNKHQQTIFFSNVMHCNT